jgi:hypothetical protein
MDVPYILLTNVSCRIIPSFYFISTPFRRVWITKNIYVVFSYFFFFFCSNSFTCWVYFIASQPTAWITTSHSVLAYNNAQHSEMREYIFFHIYSYFVRVLARTHWWPLKCAVLTFGLHYHRTYCLILCLSVINFWISQPVYMTLRMYIMAPEPILTATSQIPSVCVYIYVYIYICYIFAKLAITSSTSGGRSVGIGRSRTQTMEFSFLYLCYAAAQ